MMLEKNHSDNEAMFNQQTSSNASSFARKNNSTGITYAMFWTPERHAVNSGHLNMTGQLVEALEEAAAADQGCPVPEDLLLAATSHS